MAETGLACGASAAAGFPAVGLRTVAVPATVGKHEPRKPGETLALASGIEGFTAANLVLKDFGIRLRWRDAHPELGKQVWLHAEKISGRRAR